MRLAPVFGFAACLLVLITACARGAGAGATAAAPPPARPGEQWRLVHRETFDRPFVEPERWTEDHHGDDSPYHVDDFDDDGAFFRGKLGERFEGGLRAFRSLRKSFTYGDGGWLTVELHGRDADGDGAPESGGRFEARAGRAHLISRQHTDGALLRSTRALPRRYRVEVTVSNIAFGGLDATGGGNNGYDGDERAGPWRWDGQLREPARAGTDNGVYLLCITDYARPAPHNNVFIHRHRKVVIDTDNNHYPDGPWSLVWNPRSGRAEPDGHHYLGLFALDAETWTSDWTGNGFLSWTPGGWVRDFVMADKYLDGEAYRVGIERDGEAFTLTAAGRFHHGGATTYRARRRFADRPAIWHLDQTRYPEHFIIGDPHINYYEGTAEIDDLELWVPEGD